MRHFLSIENLTSVDAEYLIKGAIEFKTQGNFPDYSRHAVANLFYENSTRTRVSFELAARYLNMKVVNLDLQSSSESKGEVIEDTIRTLASMGISLFVVRHSQEGLPMLLAEQLGTSAHIVNAGDGKNCHPSQALLDIMTIVQEKPELSQLIIAIVGNVRHSRVAHSFQHIAALLNIKELVLVGPEIWLPETPFFGNTTTSLKEGLSQADVIICLRVQRERLLANEQLDLKKYRQEYALTTQTLSFIKNDAMIMHPGPMNRGVEIDNEVADGNQSFILEQVKNGVFMRAAILESLITT